MFNVFFALKETFKVKLIFSIAELAQNMQKLVLSELIRLQFGTTNETSVLYIFFRLSVAFWVFTLPRPEISAYNN